MRLRLTEYLLIAYLLIAILYFYLKFRFHCSHFALQFPEVNLLMLLVSFRTKCAILINECNLCTITRDYSFRPLRGLIQDMA